MSRPKALLLGKIVHAKKAWDDLASLADLVTPQATSRSQFLRECAKGQLDGVVAIYRTWDSVSVSGPFDKELIRSLPRSVKFVSHRAAGYDQIDIAACTEQGISVSNVPDVVDDSTADTAIFLMLGALRGFNQYIFSIKNGDWRGPGVPPLGHVPQGKTLGILGCGNIGRNIATKAAAFGMNIIYHNRKKNDAVTEAQYVDFDTLLRTSDVLAVSLPLNANTKHIISTAEFEKMKPGVVIVNTARGAVIDEEALAKALESERVWACGLDVFEKEPIVHPTLLSHPRALLLPHLGTHTFETHSQMELRCIANVRSALEKGILQDIVPEQRKQQMS